MATSTNFNVKNIAFQELPQRELGIIGNTVSWIRNPESPTVVKVLKYTLTFFVSLVLIFSVIGIPVLILGIKEAVKQSEDEQYRTSFADNKKIAEDNIEIGYSAGLDAGLEIMGIEKTATNSKLQRRVEKLPPELVNPFTQEGQINIPALLKHMAHINHEQLPNLGLVHLAFAGRSDKLGTTIGDLNYETANATLVKENKELKQKVEELEAALEEYEIESVQEDEEVGVEDEEEVALEKPETPPQSPKVEKKEVTLEKPATPPQSPKVGKKDDTKADKIDELKQAISTLEEKKKNVTSGTPNRKNILKDIETEIKKLNQQIAEIQ